MTTSTDGILCYGYILPDEGLPWQTDKYDNDFEKWYYSEVVPFKFAINWDSADSILRQQYFDKKWEFKQTNPLPGELVNYCSRDYPLYIIATEEHRCNKGKPVEITYRNFYNRDKANKLREFLLKYKIIEKTEKASWWLCSYQE